MSNKKRRRKKADAEVSGAEVSGASETAVADPVNEMLPPPPLTVGCYVAIPATEATRKAGITGKTGRVISLSFCKRYVKVRTLAGSSSVAFSMGVDEVVALPEDPSKKNEKERT